MAVTSQSLFKNTDKAYQELVAQRYIDVKTYTDKKIPDKMKAAIRGTLNSSNVNASTGLNLINNIGMSSSIFLVRDLYRKCTEFFPTETKDIRGEAGSQR